MIDKNASIDSKARISSDVCIGPYSVIGPDVEIGSGTSIGSNVVICGNTKIGKNNKIFHFASLGAEPQHKQYAGEDTTLTIGDDNVIREYCSINRGTIQGIKTTTIGDRNFLMAYTHIAHDCVLGNDNIFANNATLAGHVIIGSNIVFGGFVKVLQFCTLGDHCFITGDTNITKDVLPYVLVSGLHGLVKSYGLNIVGLKRRGFDSRVLLGLKRAYNVIRSDLPKQQVIEKLEAMLPEYPDVKRFIDILSKTKRGIIR